jgi:hypothetical protein
MIVGAHSIIYSAKPKEDRAFLKNVLKLPHVDAGGDWLIFGLPPSEIAVHPSQSNAAHELYLMCKDVGEFVAAMQRLGVQCGAVQNLRWGLLTRVTLPGGGLLGVYEPRHPRPKAPALRKPRPTRRTSVKPTTRRRQTR